MRYFKILLKIFFWAILVFLFFWIIITSNNGKPKVERNKSEVTAIPEEVKYNNENQKVPSLPKPPPAKTVGSVVGIPPNYERPLSFEKGSNEERALISNYFYYIDDEKLVLHRVDLTNAIGDEHEISLMKFEDWGDSDRYNFFLCADGNHIGNRFMTFYKENSSAFKVFDKQTGILDQITFNKKTDERSTAIVYPGDYLDNDLKVRDCYIRVSWDSNSKTGGGYIERISQSKKHSPKSEMLAEDKSIYSHFYNAAEGIFVWIEKTSPGTLKLIYYNIVENYKRPDTPEDVFEIKEQSDEALIWMACNKYIGVQYSSFTSNNKITAIYEKGIPEPVKRYENSRICCYSQRSNNLHVIVSEGEKIHHLYNNADAEIPTLEETKLSEKWHEFALDTKMERLFILNHLDNYFLCSQKCENKKFSFQLYGLDDNFEKVSPGTRITSFPDEFSDVNVIDIRVEGGKLIVQDKDGRMLCVGYVDEKGCLFFLYWKNR